MYKLASPAIGYSLARGYRRFGETYCVRLHPTYLTLEMKTTYPLDTCESAYQTARFHILNTLCLQNLRICNGNKSHGSTVTATNLTDSPVLLLAGASPEAV